jgi:hypothetical protein
MTAGRVALMWIAVVPSVLAVSNPAKVFHFGWMNSRIAHSG